MGNNESRCIDNTNCPSGGRGKIRLDGRGGARASFGVDGCSKSDFSLGLSGDAGLSLNGRDRAKQFTGPIQLREIFFKDRTKWEKFLNFFPIHIEGIGVFLVLGKRSSRRTGNLFYSVIQVTPLKGYDEIEKRQRFSVDSSQVEKLKSAVMIFDPDRDNIVVVDDKGIQKRKTFSQLRNSKDKNIKRAAKLLLRYNESDVLPFFVIQKPSRRSSSSFDEDEDEDDSLVEGPVGILPQQQQGLLENLMGDKNLQLTSFGEQLRNDIKNSEEESVAWAMLEQIIQNDNNTS